MVPAGSGRPLNDVCPGSAVVVTAAVVSSDMDAFGPEAEMRLISIELAVVESPCFCSTFAALEREKRSERALDDPEPMLLLLLAVTCLADSRNTRTTATDILRED